MGDMGSADESSVGIDSDDGRAVAAAHGGDEGLESRGGEGEEREDEDEDAKDDSRTKEPLRRDPGNFIERGFEPSRDGDRNMEQRGGRAVEVTAGGAGPAGPAEDDDDDDDDDSDDDDDEAVEMRVLLR